MVSAHPSAQLPQLPTASNSQLPPHPLTVFLELLIILQNSSLIDEPLFLRGDADRGSDVLLKFLYVHLQRRDKQVSGKGGGRTEEGQLTCGVKGKTTSL